MQCHRRLALSWMGSALIVGCHPFPAVAAPAVKTRFGVNFNHLFLGALNERTDGVAGLAALGRRGIPFARFAASGQWAGDWAKFEADPAHYWQVMDTVFAAAEHSGVKLIPCVMWHTVALAMHCGEAMQAWANPASRTRAMANRYTAAFVARYDRSPALMMYEFTNELNDWIDVPAATLTQFWPKKDPTMPQRAPLAQDRLTSEQLRDIGANFAGIIRKSSRKPISLGSNIPRPNAWHLARGSFDTDSHDQNMGQLRALTPANMDVLSIHLYNDKYGQAKSAFQALPDVLASFVQAAAADRRKSFVGEFGIARVADRNAERQQFEAQVKAIHDSGVNDAAVWNFSPVRLQPEWDVIEGGDRSYQLDMIGEANRS